MQHTATTTLEFFLSLCTAHLEIQQESAFCGIDSPKKDAENKSVNRSKKFWVRCIKLEPYSDRNSGTCQCTAYSL